VLILPPGHARSLATARRLKPRERWMLAGVTALVALVAVALVISLASAGRSSGHGCIDVSVQAATGGSEIYRCGAQARALCSSARPGRTDVLGAAIVRECRKAGLPVSG
jgi:type II secretory pathway component PulM